MLEETWAKLYGYVAPRAGRWACRSHRDGIAALGYDEEHPADPEALGRVISARTGWDLVRAKGEVPAPAFFRLLSRRKFPIVHELRPLEQVFAAAEPDLWHEAFGHIPLLLDPQVAALYEWFGKAGVETQARGEAAFTQLCKLYWYVGEYGLVREGLFGTKILGAGLLASPLGTQKLEHGTVEIRPFSIPDILDADYDPYKFQGLLFRIPSIAQVQIQLEAWSSQLRA